MNSILVVDQNAESCEKIARFLQDCGISPVVTAHSPEQALLILGYRRIDGIVAAFNLGGGKAITLLRDVRLSGTSYRMTPPES